MPWPVYSYSCGACGGALSHSGDFCACGGPAVEREMYTRRSAPQGCPVCGGDHEWSDADEAALRAALRPMTGTDAERQLRHRWRPGYPDPFGG